MADAEPAPDDAEAEAEEEESTVPLPTLTVVITPQGTAVAEVSTGDTVSLQSEAPRSHLDKLVDLGTDELEESWEILMQQLQEMEAQAQATPEQNGTAEAVDVDAELADEASGDLGPTEAEPVED